MKKFIYGVSILLTALSLTACSDFFDPNTDDELNGEDYISSDTEMYTGFLGIMTRLQAVGDKEILLTETRGTLVEVSEQSSPELISLYNYDADLNSNPYANPAGYYEVVIACNDYLAKMKEYRHLPGVDDSIWQDLVSSAVRIKVWAYKTLGEIYGEAVWFDDPIIKYMDITAANGFEKLSIDQLVDRCLLLLETGFDGVSTNRNINWIEWLDPAHVTDVVNSDFRKWNFMVPPFEGLYAELCLWKGACIESRAPQAPTADPEAVVYYQKAADTMFEIINHYVSCNYMTTPADPGSNTYWLPSAATPGHYAPIFHNTQPYPYEVVSAIIYDYTKNQTNTLLKHFSDEYPNKYYLRPAECAYDRFLDNDWNPGGTTSEARFKVTFGNNSGRRYIAKFREVGSSARPNPYQDDCHIYLYRATQYHFMLVEALNHLKRFVAMDACLNNGVNTNNLDLSKPEWAGFNVDWTGSASWGNRKYPSLGIRGCQGLRARNTITSLYESGTPEREAYKINDLAILDEAMIEFACEGKVYPMMNRMALRYGDLNIVADRVGYKYKDSGKESQVRAAILGGANWVKYDLQYNDAE